MSTPLGKKVNAYVQLRATDVWDGMHNIGASINRYAAFVTPENPLYMKITSFSGTILLAALTGVDIRIDAGSFYSTAADTISAGFESTKGSLAATASMQEGYDEGTITGATVYSSTNAQCGIIWVYLYDHIDDTILDSGDIDTYRILLHLWQE